MGEVGGVDGGVGCWVGGCNVHGTAGEGVFEDGEEGEVITWVGGGGRGEECGGVEGEGGDRACRKVDFLGGSLGGGEEFAEGEGLLFCADVSVGFWGSWEVLAADICWVSLTPMALRVWILCKLRKAVEERLEGRA